MILSGRYLFIPLWQSQNLGGERRRVLLPIASLLAVQTPSDGRGLLKELAPWLYRLPAWLQRHYYYVDTLRLSALSSEGCISSRGTAPRWTSGFSIHKKLHKLVQLIFEFFGDPYSILLEGA